MGKVKRWVMYCDEFPGGLVYKDREDALDAAAEERDAGNHAYVRVKYFTAKELRALPEAG